MLNSKFPFLYQIIFFLIISYQHSFAQSVAGLDTVWENYYGGNRADGILEIIETFDGKIVGVGHSKSKATFEKEGKIKKNKKEQLTSGENDDIFFLQIDEDGKDEFITVLGDKNKEAAYAVKQTYDGGFVIVGFTDSSTDRSLGGKDAWIIKLNGEKQYQWDKIFGSTQDDVFTDLIQATNGDIIACGQKGNTGFIVRLDWQGQLVSQQNLNYKNHILYPTTILELQDGNLAVAGISTNKSKSRSFFQLLNPNLNLIGPTNFYFERWQDKSGMDWVSLLELSNQNIVLTSPAYPDRDALLVGLIQLNNLGQPLEKSNKVSKPYYFQKENDSYPFDIKLGHDDKIYITGASKTHNKGGSANKNKLFLTKIDTDFSNPENEWTYYGGNFEDRAFSLLPYHTGNLFVAGASNSKNAYFGGGENAFFIKTDQVKANSDSSPIRVEVKRNVLIEENGDKLLEPNEKGYISVRVQNLATSTIHDLQATVESTSENIYFPHKMYLGKLLATSNKTVGIPIKGKKNLKAGQHEFALVLRNGDKELLRQTFKIESKNESKSDIQIIASNYESLNPIVPNKEIELRLTLQNKGNKTASLVNGYFNFEGGNITILSPNQLTIGTIEPGEIKKVSVIFKVAEIDLGKEIKAKFTYSSDTQLAYSIQKVYPFEVGIAQQETIVVKSIKETVPIEENNYDIVMVWQFPGEKEIVTDTIFQPIKLFASSKLPLLQDDFQIYLNDKWINQKGSKFGKVSLRPTKNENGRYEFTLNALITLDKKVRKNILQIKVEKGGQTYLSKSRVFIYEKQPINLHFIGIGISDYAELNGPKDLKYADDDVKDVASIFKEQEGVLFSKVYCHTLTNEKHTRKNEILSVLDDLGDDSYLSKINKNDVLIFFVSSHGLAQGNEFKILPSDYQNRKNDAPFLLDFERDILFRLKKTGIQNIFVFADACHSGAIQMDLDNFRHAKNVADPSAATILQNLVTQKLGVVPIVSCQADELSWEHDDWENGAFTEAFKEAFKYKKAHSKQNGLSQTMSFIELYDYLVERVPAITKEKVYISQTPFIPATILSDLQAKEQAQPGCLDLFYLE